MFSNIDMLHPAGRPPAAPRDAKGAARDLLEAPAEGLPEFWDELARLGWLGLHLPEAHGGSVALANRDGARGCVATLRLPVRGPGG